MTREELEIMLEKNVDEYIKTRDVWYSIKAREIEEELERIKKQEKVKKKRFYDRRYQGGKK